MNGVALVQQILVVQLLKQPPNRFNVFVVIGNVRVVHVYPISHVFGKLFPKVGVLHNLLAASVVVLFHRYGLTNVFFLNA